MKSSVLSCGAALVAIPLLAGAKDFALEFKTLDAQSAMAFPGGYGIYGTLQLGTPTEISKAPPARSKHAILGHLGDPGEKLWFCLDESKGDGQGYDRLIVDMNRNGDLTDDPAVAPTGQSERSARGSGPERAVFGPIPAPEAMKIGDWRPIYFAEMHLYNRPAAGGSSPRFAFLGQLRLKAGWYLATMVDIDGTARKVGIADGNCSIRLGDVGGPTTYQSDGATNWYFAGGDYFVLDRDGSGQFSSSVGSNESAPFGPILYLGAKPYKVALAKDCKSLNLEPWTEPLAELAFQPHGVQVNELQLAWESAPDKWQLLQPGVANGKAKVPPGNYHLYTSTLKVTTPSGGSLILNGYKRSPQDAIKAAANATTPFRCGSPLEIKVTTARDSGPSISAGVVSQIVGAFSGKRSAVQQRIQASVVGAGGETYSSFMLLDKKEGRQPPKPVFTVRTADGKQVDTGNLEFG